MFCLAAAAAATPRRAAPQVESNMARLGVSHDGGAPGAGLGSLVSSMNERDLDAAAELLATKSHFIS